jgi:putative serine protease PepD
LAAALLAIAVTGGAFAATSDDSPAAISTVTTTTVAPAAAPAALSDTATIETPVARANPTPLLLDAAAVGKAVIPSIVTVQISGAAFNGQETRLGSGSGVVYDDQGHIITNDHVVSAGTSYEIVLADGRIYPAEVVGTDPTTDLAVLEVTAEDLVPLATGDSDALTVGDPAVAVGSPLGLDGGPSLTVGVISAFGREVQTDATTILYGMLQTDAPITSGSSGGALVDSSGRLVGITTAVGVSEVGIEGIGFATPVEIVTRVADEIIATGSASSPYLGIFPIPALEATTDGGSIPVGIEVETVEPNTAASLAGVQTGDIIAAIDGIEIKTFNELVAALRRFGAGTTIGVTLGNGQVLDVTLGQRP